MCPHPRGHDVHIPPARFSPDEARVRSFQNVIMVSDLDFYIKDSWVRGDLTPSPLGLEEARRKKAQAVAQDKRLPAGAGGFLGRPLPDLAAQRLNVEMDVPWARVPRMS